MEWDQRANEMLTALIAALVILVCVVALQSFGNAFADVFRAADGAVGG